MTQANLEQQIELLHATLIIEGTQKEDISEKHWNMLQDIAMFTMTDQAPKDK